MDEKPSRIWITKHATDRLDERAYLYFFRRFTGEGDKTEFLIHFAHAALKNGKKIVSKNDKSFKMLYDGMIYTYKQKKNDYWLITVVSARKDLPRTQRRKNA